VRGPPPPPSQIAEMPESEMLVGAGHGKQLAGQGKQDGQGIHFTCSTGTKVQILTLHYVTHASDIEARDAVGQDDMEDESEEGGEEDVREEDVGNEVACSGAMPERDPNLPLPGTQFT
jgi:hypothetical protein